MKYLNFVRSILNFLDFFQQKTILNFIKNKINEDIVFFDVGAHYGESVKLFSNKFTFKECHCFEASPMNFEILRKNIDRLSIKKDIFLNKVGVGSTNKSSFINQTKESSSSTINDFNLESKYLKRKMKILNIKNKDQYFKKIPIKIISLDEYVTKLKIRKIDLVKIDTEGFEFDVIKGMRKTSNKIKLIYFEHHYDDMIKKNYNFRDINSILIKYGFKKIFKSKMYFRKSFEYIYENISLSN
tara:strand:+ start:109 stop:834 length:726 start_codon:yes stop_codon:yes gene_type:complete